MGPVTPDLHTLIGLLAIVNPLGAVPVFLALTADRSSKERQAIARTAALTVFVVLLAATWGGERILRLFGIGLPAFRVGGGLLILLMATAMLHAYQSRLCHSEEEAEEASGRESIAVVPLGIPLMAGPGSISFTTLQAHQLHSLDGRLTLSFCIALVALTVWTVLHLAEPLGRWLGVTGLNILIRIMGLLLVAIGVQIIAEGSVELFNALLHP